IMLVYQKAIDSHGGQCKVTSSPKYMSVDCEDMQPPQMQSGTHTEGEHATSTDAERNPNRGRTCNLHRCRAEPTQRENMEPPQMQTEPTQRENMEPPKMQSGTHTDREHGTSTDSERNPHRGRTWNLHRCRAEPTQRENMQPPQMQSGTHTGGEHASSTDAEPRHQLTARSLSVSLKYHLLVHTLDIFRVRVMLCIYFLTHCSFWKKNIK
uniref:Uncharacterized protein n=1 Tax=Paramormyrops kingsleyae TaxID=1676925 RepID=A0A3B3TGC5_9TELE